MSPIPQTQDIDVMVVSDHGYSTIQETVDVEWYVRHAGFSEKDALVAPNGGSVLFYCRDLGTTDRLAAWLMAQPWCGALLASESAGEIEGTLPMSLSGGDGLRAPELGDVDGLGLASQRCRIPWICLLNGRRTGPRSARVHEPPRDEERLDRTGAANSSGRPE